MSFHFPTPHLLQREFVHRQIEVLHHHLGGVRNKVEAAVEGGRHDLELLEAVRHELAAVLEDPQEQSDRGEYYSQHPVVSLVQSVIDSELARDRMEGVIEHDDEDRGDPYTRWDVPHWAGNILLSVVGRLAGGTHPFNEKPATGALKDGSRLVLIGDWGTGREGAGAVARMAQRYISEDPDQPVHVVHLGDTYYSGTPAEQHRNLLTPWPVSPWQATKYSSWALNGNHDMYGGGWGLFETTLRDPRFGRQQADRRPTSWMHLSGDRWNIVGLDTAWKDKLVEVVDGKLEVEGALGHLNDPQRALLTTVAAEDKKLLILSHHQLFVAYGEDPQPLAAEIQGPLNGRTVEAWFWGHEHDCLAYEEHAGVRAARSIGHGAIPEVIRPDPATPLRDGDETLVKPVPPADLPATHPLRAVKWEYRGYRIGSDDAHWMKHGFAVVDVDGEALHVRYVDDEGTEFEPETLT